VYGGQNPITGAAMTLWAAGTTGSYGTGASQIATTTTDSNGIFSFNVSGVSPCTTGQYLYITAVGGNPGAGSNQYAALMAALPAPCGSATANTYVIVNEVTTVASVTALQQFMSIAPGGSPAWTIGAPSANVTGMANAFTQVGNLVNISTGTSGPTTATNAISSVTYTTTITPDTNKIYTLADILAACINTNGSGTGAGTCSGLFADTTPTGSTSPTDTIQAMYYLATNAGGVGLPAHSASQGEPYYLCSTYIPGTGTPFQPYNTCSTTSYPTDWAIGLSWSTSNGTSVVGTTSAYSLAIDGSGNIWTAVSCTSGCGAPAANITEFNPVGQVQFAPVSSTNITKAPTVATYDANNTGWTASFLNYLTSSPNNYAVDASRVNSLAIDTLGNAWFSPFYSPLPTTSDTNADSLTGVLVEVSPTGTPTGWYVPTSAPLGLVIDGNNNLYFSGALNGSDSTPESRNYTSELEYSNTTYPGTYAVFDAGIDRQTTVEDAVWADNLGYVWSVAISGKCDPPGATIYRGNTADLEADGGSGTSTHDVTNATACPYWSGFADGAGGSYFTQNDSQGTNGLFHIAISGGSASLSAPVIVSEAAGTGTSNGGLDGATGTIVDGLGNVWVANSAGGVSEFSFATGAFVPLSPSGTATVPVYGFGTSYLAGKSPYMIAADASGNLWVGSSDTALHYLVGIAGPVITPISAMLKASFVGERPGAQTLASITSSLSFEALTTTNQAQTATLTNTGSAPVRISSISTGGANPGDFTVTGNNCGSTLAIGANCSITVTFASTTAGTFSAALNVASNAAGSPATATLTGMSDTSQGLSLDAGTSTSPTVPSITFPSQVAGSVSTGQAVAVTNTGSVPLSLSLATSGPGVTLFPETTTCGTSLAAGASCFVGFTFAPLVAGSYSASLTLTDNAGSGSQVVPISGTATPFTITVNTANACQWTINNGAITFGWNSVSGNMVSAVMDNYSDQLVDTTTTATASGCSAQPEGLYMDNTGGNTSGVGTFDTGAGTASCTIVGGTVTGATTCTTGSGSTPYFDWALTVPDSANANNAYTFVEHWVVFPNDPGVHTYVELVHSTSDIEGFVGQVQWVFRDNLSIFTNTYSVNAGLGILGVQDIPQPPVADTSSTDPGRIAPLMQNAVEDLHGFNNLPPGFTRQFFTKYDYAGYEYLHQAHGVYGPSSSGTTYGIWTVLPKTESLVGGPTKQDLYFTNNLDMIEAYSDHEDEPINMNTAADVAYNRIFGPYYIHFNVLGPAYNQSGNLLTNQAQLYADAISAGAAFAAPGAQYDNEAQLTAAGYVPSAARGSVFIQVNGVTGSQYTAWAVLSDPATNFQVSFNGMQYWADISSSGSTTFTGVAPGTYRLSVYVLGQWGEYRQDGIVVTAGTTTTVPAITFQPENFAGTTGETVFTIGTPDRSAHEFLHGHNTTTGLDDREYWGNWNYWMDFAANNGAVIYYATADGGTPATNNLQLWNYNHWGTSFNPTLYAGVFNSSDDTADAYQTYPGQEYAGVGGVGAEYAIPMYVAGLPGASGTNGAGTGIPAWTVHFATPADYATHAYVVLSVAVACDEGSYVIALNGNSYTWSRTNESDCMVRSGLSGYTQWFVMQWPTSALTQSAGGDNVITIGMSQQQGASDDALRLELTTTSAAPATTGWNDYTFLNGTTTPNNDAVPNP
jgi:hypothetical protein